MADFQQYYGIAVPMEGDFEDPARAAALWSNLPAGSRTFRREAPELEWSTTDYLLWVLEYDLRRLMWGMSDERRRGPEPKPLETPAKRMENMRKRDRALANKLEIDKILGMG